MNGEFKQTSIFCQRLLLIKLNTANGSLEKRGLHIHQQHTSLYYLCGRKKWSRYMDSLERANYKTPPVTIGHFYSSHVCKMYFHATTLRNNDPGSLREGWMAASIQCVLHIAAHFPALVHSRAFFSLCVDCFYFIVNFKLLDLCF